MIETYKALILDEYTRFMRRQYPYWTPANNPQLDNAVVKVALECIDGEMEPRKFVQAQYQYRPQGANFYPGHLANGNGKANYKKYIDKSTSDLQSLWDVQIRQLKNALDNTGMKLEEILADRYIHFQPWFRIIMTPNPSKELLALYRLPAKQLLNTELEEFLTSKKLNINKIKHVGTPTR
jgi:hypothetical protein